MLADLRSGSLSRSGDETSLAEPGSRLLREGPHGRPSRQPSSAVMPKDLARNDYVNELSDLLQKHASTAGVRRRC